MKLCRVIKALIKNLTKVLFTLLAIGLMLPTIYLAALPRSGMAITREYQYSQATESPVEAQIVLSSLLQTMSPNELNRLRDRLKGIGTFTQSKEDPLGEYLNVLSVFSNNMISIDLKLHDAQTSLSSGNIQAAVADLKQLKALRDETKPLPSSLYSLLDRVTAYYEINTTIHMKKIRELNKTFQTYSEQIDALDNKLASQLGLTQTILTLNSSRQEVFIEEPFVVYGFLKDQNGSVLIGKNVTISWGANMSVVKMTDFRGRFEADVVFGLGFPAGLTEIRATFEPEGADSQLYISSSSKLQIQVLYYSSKITAEISPLRVRVMDFANVNGNLLTVEGKPLASRTITTRLDGSFVSNVTTNGSGQFSVRFQVPRSLNNGTHSLTVLFIPVADRFAPSNATLPFLVELVETRVQITVDRRSLFSGMELKLNGTATYVNGTSCRYGKVAIYLDGIPYGNMTIRDDGSFLLAIQLPISLAFGSHSVAIKYNPEMPWELSSYASAQLFIYNTPLALIVAIGIPTASGLGVYLFRRSRRTATQVATLPPPILETPLPRDELTPESLISTIEAERDDASKVRRCYRLAQTLIDWKFGEAARESETHWEYFSRAAKIAPNIKDSLRRLVELFELAEYSPYPINDTQSREAKEILLEIRKELEAVK